MGKNRRAIVSLKSDDLDNSQLEQIMTQDEAFQVADFYDETATRGFQDIEWLMFVMMAIPTLDSTISIVKAIQEAIKVKVSTYLKDQDLKKRTKITVRISLPGFSFEKEEEIIVDPNQDD